MPRADARGTVVTARRALLQQRDDRGAPASIQTFQSSRNRACSCTDSHQGDALDDSIPRFTDHRANDGDDNSGHGCSAAASSLSGGEGAVGNGPKDILSCPACELIDLSCAGQNFAGHVCQSLSRVVRIGKFRSTGGLRLKVFVFGRAQMTLNTPRIGDECGGHKCRFRSVNDGGLVAGDEFLYCGAGKFVAGKSCGTCG